MWAPHCSDSIPPVCGLFLFLPLSSLLSRHPEMPCWQDDTCKLFHSLLTCRGPWPSSQTHSKALKVRWKIPLLFVALGDPSSQPGYSSYPDGGLFLHWTRGRMAKSITGQGMYTLIPSVSLSVLTWLCTREFQAPSVFLGFDSIPADPAGQVLSASCSAKSVSGAIYLVLLTFLVAFLSYGFLLVLAGLFLLLKTCLHSPSSRGNRHGWYSVSILTVSSMCLLS